ncbi:hypothetical protein ACJMK2_034939 [Sinanodonta woodiana]|uniref:NTR domain-containing protein n=1 Tax=Sinanodonta woodiana TaxID=1069815 RepID=A0ABD3WX53_SINWO
MSSMFLHSLLVLLVPIHVTLACKCTPMTLLQAMCNSTTVVLARVSDGQPLQVDNVVYRRYMLGVTTVFKEEEQKMSNNDDKGTLLFPEKVSDCGGILTDDFNYVIAGSVNSDGTLVSSSCFHYTPYRNLIGDAHSLGILLGQETCTGA